MIRAYLSKNRSEAGTDKPEEVRSTLPFRSSGRGFYRENAEAKQGNY